MSIIITTDSFKAGATCTAKLKYEGPEPIPNDVHIDAQHDDGTWHAITGYERIPKEINPAKEFEIRFSSSNPNVGGTGTRKFQVRWTIDGKQIGKSEETTEEIKVKKPMKTWWERFLEWLRNIDWKTIFDALGKLGHKK